MDAFDGLLLDPVYLDQMYAQYQLDKSSVPPSWVEFFATLGESRLASAQTVTPARFLTVDGGIPEGLPSESLTPGIQIYSIVQAFRQFGHLAADLDPLDRHDRNHPSLALEQFGFSTRDLSQRVSCEVFRGLSEGTLQEHIDILRDTYCGAFAVEFMDVVEKEHRDWLIEQMEPICNQPALSNEQRRELLKSLVAADGFEEALQKMYPGAKRFSLEGGTSLVPALQAVVSECAKQSVVQLIVGMAHRGRLNVLANVMGKPLEYILAEFEGRPLASELQGYGDVKYHMGYSNDFTDPETGNSVHLSMAFNPSHLETVNPVVEGISRAKQDRLNRDRRRVLPLLIHGDAAFAGQGVVAETFTLSGIKGYKTGGTLHIIVNNQVGFTANPDESRSTRYASDWAKSIRAPVFHVNGDHPEAVRHAAQLALRYRQQFATDVVIDIVCFRRYGHNEIDDASFTQPVMAKRIAAHPSVSTTYGSRLVNEGVVSADDIEAMQTEVFDSMRAARDQARTMKAQVTQRLGGVWKGLRSAGESWGADTRVERDVLLEISKAFLRVPEGFHWHSRLEQMMTKRATSVSDEGSLDWGTAEALSIGSLLLENTPVRLSGQDSHRGTFGHRHAVYNDLETGKRYVPLNHMRHKQARFEVLNSPLSEEAVLGFEYGYSSADPWQLVIWEAQFGDFANGAQVIVDQLIAGAEYKWGRMCGLVMLLPHGYEGQGPEHSSARLERFLELCAENNMQVCNLTTPAQYFHCLRRQMHRDFRKPLIIMSPKSLLRHPDAVSTLNDLHSDNFRPILADQTVDTEKVTHALMCSGKIYYALHQARLERKIEHAAIIRLEQLYPYPYAEAKAIMASFPKLESVTWVQEEPRNMGAWRNLLHRFEATCPDGIPLHYVGRDSRAVPATGSFSVHQLEEAGIVEAAFIPKEHDQVVRRTDTKRRKSSKQQVA